MSIIDNIEEYYDSLDDEQKDIAFVQMVLRLYDLGELAIDDNQFIWNGDGEPLGNVT